jgi:hypothetical protein
MNRIHFGIFLFGLCLFGTGVGIISADAEPGRASSEPAPRAAFEAPTPTDVVPTTTTTTELTTSTTAKQRAARSAVKPLQLVTTTTTAGPEIGTATSIVREERKTPLEIAQGEVGKTGPYADGGFWCAVAVSDWAERAEVPGWESSDSPAELHTNAVNDGRITDSPLPGYLVFIDLFGPGGVGNGQISHVGIVESVEGDTIHTVEGNADDSGLVTRQTRHIGDGFVLDFAPFGR